MKSKKQLRIKHCECKEKYERKELPHPPLVC